MILPKTPKAWANRLTVLLNAVHNAHGIDRFPVDVKSVAKDFSQQVFPDEPILEVGGAPLSAGFDGALIPFSRDGQQAWGIAYNENISSKGRQNFTLAHELGHYLLHRALKPEGFRCSSRKMLYWQSEEGQVEAQANEFASYLLMPLDDYRTQIKGQSITMDLMEKLADRYEVSLTATILKWISFTEKRAMIVVAKDGFIDWARSSKNLMRSGVFYRARQETTELPADSIAANTDPFDRFTQSAIHPPGVWRGGEEVEEFTVFSDTHEMTISMLIYPDRASSQHKDFLPAEEIW